MDPTRPQSTSAVHPDPPPMYWGDHDANPLERLALGWVASTWVACIALALAIATLASLIVASLSESPLTGAQNTDLGIFTIIGAMSTFIGFAAVITLRLVRVDHDRLINSFAVAGLHVLVSVALFAVELVLQGFGVGIADALQGNLVDQVGNAFTVLERSSAAAIIAALLSVGMVPARGERPTGTQTGATPQDLQL